MTEAAQAAAWEPRYARRAGRMAASEIRELLKVLDRPGIVSFAGGIPDPVLFPVEEAKAAYAAVLGAPTNGLQYSVSEGYLPLRQWIVRHMGSLGMPCDADNIVVRDLKTRAASRSATISKTSLRTYLARSRNS